MLGSWNCCKKDDWLLSERARREGKIALQYVHDRDPTDGEMVEYVLDLLKGPAKLNRAPQGNPPGSTGIGWQMVDEKGVFIKLRIEGGFGQEVAGEYAYIQSIHESVHRH